VPFVNKIKNPYVELFTDFIYFTPLLKGFSVSIAAITAIGAQNSFVLKQAMIRSHIRLIITICIIGDCFLIILGVNGVGILMRQFPGLINFIRYAGIAFLFLYGLSLVIWTFKRSNIAISAPQVHNGDLKKVIFVTLAVTFLNPHTYLDSMIFIGTVGAHFVGLDRVMFIVGAGAASLVWFFSIAYFGRFLRPIFENRRGRKIFDLIIAFMMWMLALSLL
jgi:L-lysine exporter family protein LysE/ArgO